MVITSKEKKFRRKLIRVKLRPHKFDRFGAGYYPIYKTVDSKGYTLTYIVKTPTLNIECNSLRKARQMAVKI